MGNVQQKDIHLWIVILFKVCAFHLDYWKMGSVETVNKTAKKPRLNIIKKCDNFNVMSWIWDYVDSRDLRTESNK